MGVGKMGVGEMALTRFHDRGVMELHCIFKAITGSSGHAFWWERTDENKP